MPTGESVEYLSTLPVEVILSSLQVQSCQAVRSTIWLLADRNNTKETTTQRLQKVFARALHQSLAAKHYGWENQYGKSARTIIGIIMTRIIDTSDTMYRI